MKKELIQELFEKFEQACYIYNDVECWRARELQIIFNYSQWKNFIKVIEKAKTSCESSGVKVSDHFSDIGKMIDLAKGAQRKIEDVALSRYACYLVAQNGDPGKNIKYLNYDSCDLLDYHEQNIFHKNHNTQTLKYKYN